MSKKVKKQGLKKLTIEQAQDASKTVAEKTNRLEKIQAKMNQELNTVKTRYSDEITVIKEELVEPTELLKVYAKEQRENWGDKKSHELTHCILGFRTCNPKVSKQDEFTWDEVLEMMKKNKCFKSLIRVKEEINKEAILSLKTSNPRDNRLLNQLKDECSLFIHQPETFFITPKKEAIVN